MGKATKTTKIEAAKKGEVVKVNFVRVETTELRKYPMHLLQSQGSAAKEIVIRDTDANGKEIIRWRVLFTSPEGSPGALAYRIDRLIIDKCLEAHREVPKVLRLGTLNEICDALDIDRTGHNTKNIQTALMQLYGTEIDCDSESTVRFKRFQWICFTGKKIPDTETRADAVYIGLSDPYQKILSRAGRRPLDYDYLRALPPAASRFYEVISCRIFAALQKGGKNSEARLLYSEFTELSALTRYFGGRDVRQQMTRIHKPHIASGYISGVSYDARTDKFGRPDWMMIYVPGEKARHEFKAATKRGEVAPPAEVIDITDARPEPMQTPLEFPATRPLTEAQQLAERLFKAGVSITRAQALVELYADAAKLWVDVFESGCLDKKDDPPAYLVKMIADNAPAPKAYREAKEVGKRAAKAREREIQAKQRDKAKGAWEREELVAMRLYLEGLSLDEAQKFDGDVIAALPIAKRKMLDLLQGGGREETLDCYRLAHWRRVQQSMGVKE